ncbi:hypothetical protein F5Y10DRAFT_142167 [Nemania abortiva]|nr:hypothetical protein F5Y10DRAFT_142167 [Nemania abortiva]
MSQETSSIIVFPSYYSPTWGKAMLDRVRIWEAARATSAATSFFEPLAIDGRLYADGATGANNPIYELWAEASSIYRQHNRWRLEDHLKCLVSIGTGIPSKRPFGPGLIEVATALKSIATESESKAQLFQRQHPYLVQNSILFRFNVVDGLQGVGLEAADQLSEIEASADHYCASVPVMQQIRVCASRLREKPWLTDAILAFDRRLKHHSTATSYSNPLGHYPRHELERYVHTRAFQHWLCNREHSLICTTPVKKAPIHDPVSLQNQLAASLVKYSEATSNCVVLHVNCFWLLKRPRRSRLETIAPELRNEGMYTDNDDDYISDTAIMESLYCQLFKLCNSREETLRDYNRSLSIEHSFKFRAHITRNGVPGRQDLLQLMSGLRSHSTSLAIISIDCLHLLTESAQNRLVSDLRTLTTQGLFKSILCGDESLLLARNIMAHYSIISVDTEMQECLASLSFGEIDVRKSQVTPAAEGTTSWIWSHPVYQSFSTHDSGILWIRGKPGSGKSVLARSIQKRIRESSFNKTTGLTTPLVGDWFYHGRKGGGFVRHESFVRSVIYHFLQQDSLIFRNFVQEYYRDMDPREKSLWSYDLLVKIFRKVCEASTPMVIVIDAVDEAEDAEVLHLIKSITNQTNRSRARFIVLSRPNIWIEQGIAGEPTIVVEHENKRDIKRIIDIGLISLHNAIHSLDFTSKNEYSKRRHLSRNYYPRQPRLRSLATVAERENQIMRRIGELLMARAQGSMLWVRLVLDRLTHQGQGDHGSTLNDLLGLVNQVPEQLAEYYQQLAHDLTAHKDANSVSEIRMALMWICAAAEIEDVTLESLWEAFALFKVKFEAKTLEDVWHRQLILNSYDELWRKFSVICGPFIEIFNPGLSAEESRIYHYGGSSVVQLMHHSMRDFLCDPNITDHGLHFSMDEARKMVRSQLEYYLRLSASDLHRMKSNGPHESLLVVHWLNDQKLLYLAITTGETKWKPLLQTLWLDGVPQLQEVSEDPDSHLIEAAKTVCADYWKDETLMTVGRLTYHACTQGLVTAMRNMFFLRWLSAELFAAPRGQVVILSILLVAFQCESGSIILELDPYRRKLEGISSDKRDIYFRCGVAFKGWSSFLDMLYGSNPRGSELVTNGATRHDAAGRREEEEEDAECDIILVEYVEGTIITALSLGLKATQRTKSRIY